MKRKFHWLSVLTVAFVWVPGVYSAEQAGLDKSPWGISTHAHKGEEWDERSIAMTMCKQAQIQWIRTDFQFSKICRNPNQMDFSLYDQFVEEYTAAGFRILPILQAYSWEVEKTRPEVVPIWEHLEQWREFVRRTVSRYADRIKVWEIWNEQDGGFWRPNDPSARQYVPLLKAAYEEIKAIDQRLQVMVGGLCGWRATSYLKDMYEAGAKGYFDLIAVHPYSEGLDCLEQREAYNAFRAVMAQYGEPNKKIWITEGGCSTYLSPLIQEDPQLTERLIRFGLDRLGRPANRPFPLLVNKEREHVLSGEYEVKKISPAQLHSVDPKQYPVFLLGNAEAFPQDSLSPLRNYLERGGLVVAIGSFPFYYVVDSDGKKLSASSKTGPMFRIGFETWWTTNRRLPETYRRIQAAEGLEEYFRPVHTASGKFFISTKNQEEGDEYTPIFYALDEKGEKIGDVCGLFTYHDWKGGFLILTSDYFRGCSPSQQAALWQRVYLTYLAEGIEKIFLYDLHCDGPDSAEREHNYGMLNYDWTPRETFFQYREMVSSLGPEPEFLSRIKSEDEGIWALVFRNHRMCQNVLAIWSRSDKAKVQIFWGNEPQLSLRLNSTPQYYVLDDDIQQYTIRRSRE